MQALTTLSAVERELTSKNFWLEFPRQIEVGYLAQTDGSRRIPLFLNTLLGVCIYCAFGLFDSVLIPDILEKAMFVRAAVVMPVCLAAVCFYLAVPSTLTRDLGLIVVYTTCELGVTYMMLESHAPLRSYVHIAAPLILLYIMTTRIATFRSLLISAMIGIPVYAWGLTSMPEIPMPVRYYSLVVMAAVTISTVATGYYNERDLRRFFLFSLRDRLRNEELNDAVLTDPLTGLGNRRMLDERLPVLWQDALKSGQPLAVAMLDIDRFKAYNDMYGHPAGDACIASVARLASRAMGAGCLDIRFGGEEMLFVFPDCNLAQAKSRAEAMRQSIEAAAMPHAGNSWEVVTVSVGVSSLVPSTQPGSPDMAELLAAADAALYAAKTAGRNVIRPALIDGSVFTVITAATG